MRSARGFVKGAPADRMRTSEEVPVRSMCFLARVLTAGLLCLVPASGAVAQTAIDNRNAPQLAFDTTDPLKLPPGMNLGEVLSVAVNSKGTIVVLNHPGSAASGPLYGNATTQLLEFDATGKFIGEFGKGVYGLGYAHSVQIGRAHV